MNTDFALLGVGRTSKAHPHDYNELGMRHRSLDARRCGGALQVLGGAIQQHLVLGNARKHVLNLF